MAELVGGVTANVGMPTAVSLVLDYQQIVCGEGIKLIGGGGATKFKFSRHHNWIKSYHFTLINSKGINFIGFGDWEIVFGRGGNSSVKLIDNCECWMPHLRRRHWLMCHNS